MKTLIMLINSDIQAIFRLNIQADIALAVLASCFRKSKQASEQAAEERSQSLAEVEVISAHTGQTRKDDNKWQ
uniref:Uncharacterized protein n=1 Tax=Onchocerca volvulus TaxID=6282 RepID=A0A8R1Y1N6_ONCVO